MTALDPVAAVYYIAKYQNGEVEEALVDGSSPYAPKHRSSDTPWDAVVKRGLATAITLRIVTIGGAEYQLRGAAIDAKILVDKSGVLVVYSKEPSHLDKDFYLPPPHNAAIFNADASLRLTLANPNEGKGWYIHSAHQEKANEIGVNVTNDEEWPDLLYCRLDEVGCKLIDTGISRDRR
ncbi:MAG: hypothetical protein EPO09_00625 [Aquabacterium sp.]|uniref:hypothetical protein n=1 Tax=Aquabacterium sp. TaxID=1872578 RepID=UPI0012156BAD|nr:hypothetical protein [Aquabacterium sp.]TAK99769.1 MAG: hypothetical protein EPO09_00625 [Aquabacterium sp.]